MAFVVSPTPPLGQGSAPQTVARVPASGAAAINGPERLGLAAVTRFLLEGTGIPSQQANRRVARVIRLLLRPTL
ncbi:MAG: hypothetical protein OXG37_08915 [Actinomycetia bacterium]|nr:hypothetical protein [Actinomycetes bacterium]